MLIQASRGRLAPFALAGVMACGLVIKMHAQTSSAESKPARVQSSQARGTSPKVYEDNEVRIPIPESWVLSTGDGKALSRFFAQPALGPSYGPGNREGQALLEKKDYTLALAYDTEYASPTGRFIELLRIPWLDDLDQAWTCAGFLGNRPQPVSRTLMFVNLIFRTGDSRVREKCDIEKNLGYWAGGSFVGEERWFAGYFTTAEGGYFFDSDGPRRTPGLPGSGCGEKAYTLTSKARFPEDLPRRDDPALRKIISEAIDIVDSIQYKRCPPATTHQKL